MLVDLVKIYVPFDDFCSEFSKSLEARQIGKEHPSKLTISEIGTILISFQLSGFRTLKDYYFFLKKYHSHDFPNLTSYNRFVELIPLSLIYLVSFLYQNSLTKPSELSFIDSTSIKVCHNRRIYSHKVFKNLAQRGKNSLGFFFGFKLHLIVNESGEIVSFVFSPGNTDDRKPVPKMTKEIFGYLFADKGYICQELFEKLYSRGLKLVTNIKKNMKNKLVPIFEKVMLRKRAIIESVNDFLKNICQIEHTRHRSPVNPFTQVAAALIAYSFLPSKPSLNLKKQQLLQIQSAL